MRLLIRYVNMEKNNLKNICFYLHDHLFLLNTKNKALLVSAFLIRFFRNYSENADPRAIVLNTHQNC